MQVSVRSIGEVRAPPTAPQLRRVLEFSSGGFRPRSSGEEVRGAGGAPFQKWRSRCFGVA